MAKLSISKAWDESRELLSRNGKLLMTVAAAMFLLPQVVAGVITGVGEDAAPSPPLLGAPMAIAALIGLIGQLAVAWLAIGSGVSVGESIRHGARRALPYLGAVLIMVLGFVAIFAVAALLLMLFGLIDSASAAANPTPRDVLLVLLLVLVPLLYLSVRLLPSSAVAVAEQRGPLGILKRSWALTSGQALRLIGFMAAFVVAALIMALATGMIAGVLVELAFGGSEPFSPGALVLSLANGLVQAIVVLIYVVMVARIYVQLSGGRSSDAPAPTKGT